MADRSALGRHARLALLAALSLAFAAVGCGRGKQDTAMEYMPNMAYGPRVAAQHEDPLNPGRSVNRNPVPGTVPRDFTPYRLAQEDTVAAMREFSNPLPRTAEVLGRGQRVYMNTCVVCHGELGDGQGYIVPIYPMPPSLVSEKVRAWPDSRIFHIISRGQNLMPSYASQVLPEDRWAAVHYVRALQRAAHPTPADLAAVGGGAAGGAAAGESGGGGAAGAPADTAAAKASAH
ncbi:MAG TPA: cytochrome c [Candidatus Eisenbacteria bacterium]|nr:cytochrome c [Candidatus Eisenbacteria bacterium]